MSSHRPSLRVRPIAAFAAIGAALAQGPRGDVLEDTPAAAPTPEPPKAVLPRADRPSHPWPAKLERRLHRDVRHQARRGRGHR